MSVLMVENGMYIPASMPDGEFGFSTIHPHNDNGLAEASVAFLEQKHSKPFFL